MTCERKSGVRNAVQMTVTLEGDQLSGKISQGLAAGPAGRRDERRRVGNENGRRGEPLVRWQGATPTNTTITLKLTTPASYSMQADALGATMMDLAFRRTSMERPPPRNAR